MAKYLKDDFKWDFGEYLSQIHFVYSKVSGSIKRFSECLQNKEKQETGEIEIEEDFGTVKINEELAKSLLSLEENLKSEAFFNSLLISAYSFLEFGVIEYCRLVEGYLENEIKLSDYNRPTGLNEAKKFLLHAFELNIFSLKKWNEINEYRKHRNLIVHNNSNIIKEPEKNIENQPEFKIFDSNDDLEITSAGYVFIKNIDYINNLTDFAVEFHYEIIEKTKEKIK